jgi:hypothetical protein
MNRLGKKGVGDTSSICGIVKSKVPGKNANEYAGLGTPKWNSCCNRWCTGQPDKPELLRIGTLLSPFPADPTGGATTFNKHGMKTWASRNLAKVIVPSCTTVDFYR